MKNILKKLLISTVVVFMSSGANASLIKGDWQEQGDNLSVVDTVTGMEWLSMTETIDMSINDVSAELNSTYAGWRLPTTEEVDGLLNNFYYTNMQSIYLNVRKYYYDVISDKMGRTTIGGQAFSMGRYLNTPDNIFGPYDVLMAGISRFNTYNNQIYRAHRQDGDMDTHDITSGVFLVSDGGATLASLNNPSINANNTNPPYNALKVPVPASFTLFGIGLIGFLVKRKKMKK